MEKVNEIVRNMQIDRFQEMRQEMHDYYNRLNLSYPKAPSESFKNKSTETMKGNELDINITDRNRSYGDSRVYRYKINDETALRFDQIPFPECCGIAIIKNFSANSDMSRADFLDAMDQFIADMKKNDRYSKVLFYTKAGSTGDRLFQLINGITILDPFRNKRSGNTLIGFEIDLLEKSTESGWQSMEFGDEAEDIIDDEEADDEHDEDEEEDDDPFGLELDAIRHADSGMQNIIQAQAILDGDPQPVADSTRIAEASRGGRPTVGVGMMEQINPRDVNQIIPTNGNPRPTLRSAMNDPWYDARF